MTTYDNPPAEAVELLREVMNEIEDHAPLVDAGVTVALRWCNGSETKDGVMHHALKLHGVRALAIAKIRSYEHRTEGLSDAIIKVDGDWWHEASREERIALLDHELLHFTVKKTEEGDVDTDDCGRPKLRTRHHDYETGHFRAIAQRHGMASQECQQMKRLWDESGQQFFPLLFAMKPDGSLPAVPPLHQQLTEAAGDEQEPQ